jgi:hypothetical protein
MSCIDPLDDNNNEEEEEDPLDDDEEETEIQEFVLSSMDAVDQEDVSEDEEREEFVIDPEDVFGEAEERRVEEKKGPVQEEEGFVIDPEDVFGEAEERGIPDRQEEGFVIDPEDVFGEIEKNKGPVQEEERSAIDPEDVFGEAEERRTEENKGPVQEEGFVIDPEDVFGEIEENKGPVQEEGFAINPEDVFGESEEKKEDPRVPVIQPRPRTRPRTRFGTRPRPDLKRRPRQPKPGPVCFDEKECESDVARVLDDPVLQGLEEDVFRKAVLTRIGKIAQTSQWKPVALPLADRVPTTRKAGIAEQSPNNVTFSSFAYDQSMMFEAGRYVTNEDDDNVFAESTNEPRQVTRYEVPCVQGDKCRAGLVTKEIPGKQFTMMAFWAHDEKKPSDAVLALFFNKKIHTLNY